MTTRARLTKKCGAAAVSVVSAIILATTPPASAETVTEPTACRYPAPIYRNVPRVGLVIGDVSESPLSYCHPSDDRVRVRSPRPRFDDLGQAWLPVVVSSPHSSRRTGWMVRRHLDLPVRAGEDAAYIPVRPAHG